MNVHLPRWIRASLTKYFADVVATISGVKYFVEGVNEEEAEDFQGDSVLFRMVGPYIHQGSSTDWYDVEIQILCTDIIQTTKDNAYDIDVTVGVLADAMLSVMPIYKYGNGPSDDRTELIGCLEADDSVRQPVRIVPYGISEKDTRVKQVSINGKFKLCL
jgi:hypothetical protein